MTVGSAGIDRAPVTTWSALRAGVRPRRSPRRECRRGRAPTGSQGARRRPAGATAEGARRPPGRTRTPRLGTRTQAQSATGKSGRLARGATALAFDTRPSDHVLYTTYLCRRGELRG